MAGRKIKPTGCCEPFDPKPWENKIIVWKNKLFVKDHVTCFLHIPLNMGAKITQNMAMIDKAKANAAYQLMLCDESLWGSDIYIDVAKPVPGAQMTTMTGAFLTKVFEGPYQNAGQWAKKMKEYVADKNQEIKKLYYSYSTCPKCAKAYGKNYAVLFAKID